MNAWAWLAVAIVAETAATSALKAAEGFTQPLPSAAVVVGYIIAFYGLSMALRAIPLGVAYAVWAGGGIVLITLIGWLVYRQTLDLPALVGIALIGAGIVVLNLSQAGVR